MQLAIFISYMHISYNKSLKFKNFNSLIFNIFLIILSHNILCNSTILLSSLFIFFFLSLKIFSDFISLILVINDISFSQVNLILKNLF